MYEVEIKSLLGNTENANAFRTMLLDKGALQTVVAYSQLNHYFTADKNSVVKAAELLAEYLSTEKHAELTDLSLHGSKHSVRTRAMEDKVIFVIKASVDNTTSENGIARREFEEEVKLSLEELDQLLLDAGCKYQAKWSRIREEYSYNNMNICLDKNAGYGYLTEFELVISDADKTKDAENQVRKTMSEFGLVELDQNRLSRMFDFYNNNWRDYYGTENIFTVE